MPSNLYWIKRAAQRFNATELFSTDQLTRILRAYSGASKDIERMIDDVYRNYSKQTGLDKQTLMTMMSYRETDRFWQTMEGKHLKQYVMNNYRSRITRLEKLKGDIYAKTKELAYKEYAIQTQTHKDIMKGIYNSTIQDTFTAFDRSIGFNQLDELTIKQVLNYPWSGKNYSQRIWDNTDDLAEALSDIMTRGVMTGASKEKMSREVRDRLNASKSDADRLIRTESNYFHNQAEAKAYEDMGVEQYEYLATLDARTSPICQRLDGKRFKLKDMKVGVNYPPMHPRCRSTVIAYFGDEYAPTLRRARNLETGENEVIPNIPYEQWAANSGNTKPVVSDQLIRDDVLKPLGIQDDMIAGGAPRYVDKQIEAIGIKNNEEINMDTEQSTQRDRSVLLNKDERYLIDEAIPLEKTERQQNWLDAGKEVREKAIGFMGYPDWDWAVYNIDMEGWSEGHFKWFKAGFEDKEPRTLVAQRYGEIPRGGISVNHATGVRERGVSTLINVSHHAEVYSMHTGRELITIQGWYFGELGADGEVLLWNPRKLDEDEIDKVLAANSRNSQKPAEDLFIPVDTIEDAEKEIISPSQRVLQDAKNKENQFRDIKPLEDMGVAGLNRMKPFNEIAKDRWGSEPFVQTGTGKNFADLDNKTRQEVILALDKFFVDDNYGKLLHGKLNSVILEEKGSGLLGKNETAGIISLPDGSFQLVLSDGFNNRSNLLKELKESYGDRHNASPNIEGVINHEIAHMLTNTLQPYQEREATKHTENHISSQIVKKVFGNLGYETEWDIRRSRMETLFDIFANTGLSDQRLSEFENAYGVRSCAIREGISKYADSKKKNYGNDSELIAESFAYIWYNGRGQNKLADAVFDELMGMLGTKI